MDFSPAASIFELLDPKSDLSERDLGGEKQVARLSSDEFRDSSSRFRSAELRYDVSIEEPTPHRLTCRTGDLMVIRSKFTSASGDVASAATISRPEIGRRIKDDQQRGGIQ